MLEYLGYVQYFSYFSVKTYEYSSESNPMSPSTYVLERNKKTIY